MQDTTIVGAGFTGLSAAFYLLKKNPKLKITIIESGEKVGGLASSFSVEGTTLDCFYHHWFNNDKYVLNLIQELNLEENIFFKPTNTSIYYSNNFYKLSKPFDLIKFKALPFFSRLRLGFLTLYVRSIKNWKPLENITAVEWLLKIGGKNVFNVVWKPLLIGKFGSFYDKINAVWFWNKIKLRGGSRNKLGKEELLYYKGGFQNLANEIKDFLIKEYEVSFKFNEPALRISQNNEKWIIETSKNTYNSDKVIVTVPLPIFSKMISNFSDSNYIQSLNSIPYLSNICLILVLNKPLSDVYWLNVNDPNFPFVAIIEHTNFEEKSTFNGKSIIYLSKYLEKNSKLYSMSKNELTEFSVPYIKSMFPNFDEKNIENNFLWKADYAQPVVEKFYSKKIPSYSTPYKNLYLASMAQIYPEDRGTNYAVREGLKISEIL